MAKQQTALAVGTKKTLAEIDSTFSSFENAHSYTFITYQGN